MNKLFINLYIPALDESYDIFIPVNKKVGTVKNTIINSIKGLNIEDYKLIGKEDGKIFDDNIYVKNSGIINGAKLVLL